MKQETQSLATFAEAQAAERLKTFAANLYKTEEHPKDEDNIHDLRVSIRRFTQALRVFKDLWDPRHYRKMRRSLRKLMDLCAAARNCDVGIEILHASNAEPDKTLTHYLRKRRSHAESDLSEELGRWKSKAAERPWKDWLSAQPVKEKAVEPRARRVLRQLRQEYRKAGSRAAQPKARPEDLHGLRLAAKRLRYSLEIFGALGGADWEQEIERIREVQDLLGAINDCVTTNALLAESDHKTEVRQSKAALKHMLDQRLEAFRAHWRTAPPASPTSPGRKAGVSSGRASSKNKRRSD
jgi:CHAD domain-containing protein